MTKEVMKQALDALNESGLRWPNIVEAIKVLEEALKQEQEYEVVDGVGRGVEIPAGLKYYYIEPKLPLQQKQGQGEPVAWDDLLKDAQQIVKDKFLYWMADFAQQYITPQPKQEQDEPIAWLEENSAKAISDLEKQAWIQAGRDELVETYNRPLYTTPQPKEWVGLIDEDMKDPKTSNFDFIYGARWAEQILKERNT